MAFDIRNDGVYKLAERHGEDTAVVLYWDSVTGAASVVVADHRCSQSVQLDVDPGVAFDAYHRPAAYAAALGRPLPAGIDGRIAA